MDGDEVGGQLEEVEKGLINIMGDPFDTPGEYVL